MTLTPLQFEKRRVRVDDELRYETVYGSRRYSTADRCFIIWRDSNGWRVQGTKKYLISAPSVDAAYIQSDLWKARFKRRRDALQALQTIVQE